MNKYVDNYWVEELPNEVIHLLINCNTREFYYHAYDHYSFQIYIYEHEEFNENYSLDIEPFLPKLDKTTWIMTSQKEKDQLSFYYIPYKHEWIKGRKYLIEPK